MRSRRECAGRRHRRPRAAARPGPRSRLEESIPALALTQPALRLGDQDAAFGAHDPPALREDELDERGVLVELRRPAPGAVAGLDVGEAANAPLDLRDGLLRDRPRSRRRRGSAAAAISGAQIVALAQLGDAGEGPDPQLARGHRWAQAAACWARSPSCQSDLGGPRRRLRVEQQPVSQQREVLGRVEIDRQGLDLLEREADGRPPAPWSHAWRSCPGRRRAGTGRAESASGRSFPFRGGRERSGRYEGIGRDARRARRCRACGQSTGSIATLRAPSAIAARAPAAAASAWPSSVSWTSTLCPNQPGLPSDGGVGGDDEHIVDAPAPAAASRSGRGIGPRPGGFAPAAPSRPFSRALAADSPLTGTIAVV